MNIEQLTKLLNSLKANNVEVYAKLLNDGFNEHNIVSNENIARFLANSFCETGKFKTLKESLYYTSADRLKLIYPSTFIKKNYKAEDYLKNSNKLADLVYDDRIVNKNLGNINNGDGSKYLGRGFFQTTGRANYTQLKQITGIDFVNTPELLEEPKYAVISALKYWDSRDLNSKKTFVDTRKAIAGSSNQEVIKPAVDYYNSIVFEMKKLGY